MEEIKREFIEFIVDSGVLTFGDFTTKSGRKTPFFINTGNFYTAEQLRRLGGFYAETALREFKGEFDVVFGPAYKGIPIASSAAVSLAEKGYDTKYCFNRKEIKDHGERGALLGYSPVGRDRVLILEDVTTAGTSIRETVPILRECAEISLTGLIVSVDRQERGRGGRNALTELSEEFSMRCASIVNIEEVIEYLYNNRVRGRWIINEETMERIREYRRVYGAE